MVSQVTVGSEETAVSAIVSALSEREDVSCAELRPPLGTVVEPSLVNKFVDEGRDDNIEGELEFTYGDYTVTVMAEGTISISAAASSNKR